MRTASLLAVRFDGTWFSVFNDPGASVDQRSVRLFDEFHHLIIALPFSGCDRAADISSLRVLKFDKRIFRQQFGVAFDKLATVAS